MTTPPDLPTLDALHALSTPGEWTEADTKFMTALRDAYPALSARIRELEADLRAAAEIELKRMSEVADLEARVKAKSACVARLQMDLSRVLSDGTKHNDQDEARIHRLEETLRGIRQEKADELQEKADELASYGKPGFYFSKDRLEKQIAWIDRVLRGEP